MLFQITILVDLSAMAICLWMAFFLFARGYPNRITLRAVVVMLALSAFYYGAFNNMFEQIEGSASWRATFLIVALGVWYSITLELLPANRPKSTRWWKAGVYTFGAITIILLLSNRNAFVGEAGNVLYAAKMGDGLPYTLYAIFLIISAIGMLYNLLSHNKVGLTSQGRFFLLASVFPSLQIINGIISLGFFTHEPRLIGDFLLFAGVFILGISIARHQTWIERRTILQDFPVSSLTVLFFVILYTFLALRFGLPQQWIATLVAVVVLTHAAYDLMREFLDRVRSRNEDMFRRQLRQFGNDISDDSKFKLHLQEILELLCQTLNASGGLIAIRQSDEFIVYATRSSVPLESRISASLLSCEDVSSPNNEQINYIDWVAPSFEGQIQVAVVGIGKPKHRLEYSTGNLELLAEIADQVGTLISLSSIRPQRNDQIRQLVAESQTNYAEINSITNGIMDSISVNPDGEFIKIVEEALRHLSDVITLGQSPLAEKLVIKGESHIERGKSLQQILTESIDSLKPAEKRPPEPLPRHWYNHAVLYDAYVEGVPNREIMARLYISEGTFNRTRRNALRGLSRLLIEKNKIKK